MGFFTVSPELYRQYKDQILELANSFQRDVNEHLPPAERKRGLSDREIAERLGLDERVVTEITQQIDPATSENPKTAKVQSGRVAPFQTFKGPLPGKFLLSPTELQDAGGGAR